MYIKIKNNEFIGFFEVQDDETIEITDEKYNDLIEKHSKGYSLVVENGDVVAKSLDYTGFIKGRYDSTIGEIVETATLEEQLDYYRKLIIAKTRELAVTEAAGFRDEKLEKELEEAKAIHMELSHEMANEINLTY